MYEQDIDCFFFLLLLLDLQRKVAIISSPEHEVLMVSYFDQSMSVVCCARSTIV